MGRKSIKLKKILMVKVESIADIARITASSISMNQPTYVVRIKIGQGKAILGSMAVFRDYYSLYGVPMLYYYECTEKECLESNYISFKLDEAGEHVKLTSASVPGTIMVPIINLAEPPAFIGGGDNDESSDE